MLSALVQRTVDPRRPAAVRIGVGLAVLALWREVPAVLTLLARDGDVWRVPVVGWAPVIPPTLPVQYALAWLLCGVLLLLGVAAPVAAAGVAVLAATALLTDQALYSNHLVLLTAVASLLVVARPAEVWALRRRRPPRAVPAWPMFLVATQLSTLYVFAGLAKLTPVFLSGEVIVAFAGPVLTAALAALPWLAPALGVGAAVAELALGVGIWVPATHRLLVPVGVALHVTIAATMVPTEELIGFAVLILATYPAFVVLRPVRAARRAAVPADAAVEV